MRQHILGLTILGTTWIYFGIVVPSEIDSWLGGGVGITFLLSRVNYALNSESC